MHCVFFQKLLTRRRPFSVVRGNGEQGGVSKWLAPLLTAHFSLLTFLISAQSLQITGGNTPPFTPNNLISNVFLGEGVDVTSVVFKGKPEAVGYFTGGTQSIGIERGILLTSGSAKNASGNGNTQNDVKNGSTATDFDLNAIATSFINDVVVYEIKFIPTADTLRFRYCFASEEYPEFACKTFNDVFAFFIQGPGYPTPTNIAKIPGTNQVVSINTLHPAVPANNCPAANAQFYNSNLSLAKQPIYDGFTDVFNHKTDLIELIRCQRVHGNWFNVSTAEW